MLDISAVLTFIFHFYLDIGVLFVILFGNPCLEEASPSFLVLNCLSLLAGNFLLWELLIQIFFVNTPD